MVRRNLNEMNILFLTLARIESFNDRGVYTDLLRKFSEIGHNVYVISPIERRYGKKTFIVQDDRGMILNVKSFNIQKANILEKGIGTLAIEYQFLFAIKKYFSDVKFDLILYSTPPITFAKVIDFVKKRDNAYSYLLLKDIFPQNAVDMKMIKEGGFLHKHFLKKEKKLYEISDTIGCMSPANVDFVLKHNPEVSEMKVEVNPNTISPSEFLISSSEINNVRTKNNLPLDKKIFVYGGNLGKPQGIDFLLETIKCTLRKDAFFLIIGSGTEYGKIKNWFEYYKPTNAKLMKGVSKEEYEKILQGCDVGMLFLHKDFKIPNFPSRLLSYLELKLPVLAATDSNTDVGTTIENAKCGYSVFSGNQIDMQNAIDKFYSNEEQLLKMKENSWKLLTTEFNVNKSFELIINKINK